MGDERGSPEDRIRVSDVAWSAARPAGKPCQTGLGCTLLYSIRDRVVPVLHAPPRRTSGECGFSCEKLSKGIKSQKLRMTDRRASRAGALPSLVRQSQYR